MNAQALPQATVIRRSLAPALYELAYSDKQKAVFVASAGGREKDAPQSRILRLDPTTLAVVAEIPLKERGLGVALDDDGNRLYVGNAFDAAVTVIDTQTNGIVGTIRLAEKIHTTDFEGKPTERAPHNLRELVLDKARHRLFAPGIWIEDSALYVADTRSLQLEKVIPGFGFGAAGATVDEASGKLYVGNMQGQLFTIDTRSLVLERQSEVAADQLLNLAFDKRQQRVLAVDQGGGNVDMVRRKFAKLAYQARGEGNWIVVIDPRDGQVETRIPTGQGPVAVLIDEARHRLIVTNRGSGTVTVHSLDDYRLLHTLDLPSHPNSLALDRQTGAIFATVKNSDQDPKGSNESVVRIAF